MLRLPDIVIYGVIVLLIYSYANRHKQIANAPLPPEKFEGMLPDADRFDPEIMIKINRPQSGIGTAFAINKAGKWVTARHVVDGCDSVGIRLDGTRYIPVEVEVSKRHDLAILTGSLSQIPIRSDLYNDRQKGEYGFFFGFPQGRPGEVAGKLIGRGNMKIRGRYQSDESVLAWAEIGRSLGLKGSLGGLSGAPVLDGDGEIIGVVSAESQRRGRIYSVAPKNLRHFIQEDDQIEAWAISSDNYGLEADRYRRRRQITQIVCLVI